MKITFRIQYRTVWGESLCIFLNQQQIQHTVEMTTRNGEEWTGEANFDFLSSAPITYRYAVSLHGKVVRKEFGAIPHSFYPGNVQQQHYLIEDCWRDLPQHAYLYTSAFNHAYTPEQPSKLSDNAGRCITFRALCPGLRNRKQQLGVIGSCAALGNWEYCRPLRMKEVQPNVWHLTLDASTCSFLLNTNSWLSRKRLVPWNDGKHVPTALSLSSRCSAERLICPWRRKYSLTTLPTGLPAAPSPYSPSARKEAAAWATSAT